MQAPLLCIGVDVSKAELVIASAGQKPYGIANNAARITEWLRAVPRHAHLAMESTGRYHALLAQLAYRAGLTVYVLNARDVYFYARALGVRAKTDGVDGTVIARYVAEHHARLHPWRPASAAQQRLQQLLSRRAQLVVHQSAVRQLLTGVDGQALDTQALYAGFASLLRSIDEEVQRLIGSDERMAQGYRRLTGITGIGAQTAALLTELFSRLPFANANALVAYSGLDPRPNDSGKRRGRRRLSKKGPALLRRQLYLVGAAAAHSNALKPLYQAIRAKGFAGTEAVMILGRKLLRVAFAVWRSGAAFDPARLVARLA